MSAMELSLSCAGHPSGDHAPTARRAVARSDTPEGVSGVHEASEGAPQPRIGAAEPPTGGRTLGPYPRPDGRGDWEEDFVAIRVMAETARHIAVLPARARAKIDPVTGEEIEPAWVWLPREHVRFSGNGEIELPEGLARRVGLL